LIIEKSSIAVVGGGLFGVTTALALDGAGLDVDIYEQADDIMTAASWTNQWRLHRGYHYPRSSVTARECKRAANLFEDRFSNAVIKGTDHYYCIAEERTKTTGDEFLSFCDAHNLKYEQSHPEVVKREGIDVSVRVPEHRIDPHALKAQCWQELQTSSIDLHFGDRVTDLENLSHDYVIVATYAGIDTLLDDWEEPRGRYKYQLVEKPLIKLPDRFNGTSVVILDGPFMCFDPYGRTRNFLLGNVVHAVHDTAVGERPALDDWYDTILNKGLIRSPEITKFAEFIESGLEFVPGLADAEHIGSLYTMRTVLADVEDTDERPTIVERRGNIFKVFSGKLASSVSAARQILTEISVENPVL